MKNHSHLPKWPVVKKHLDGQKRELLCSWAQIGVTCAVSSSNLELSKAGGFFRVRALFSFVQFSEWITCCLLLPGFCSWLCFAHPKIWGEVHSCVRLEMPCGMQGIGKKSKPLAYRPQSWHRLRLWASHNCLGTAILFCWHVISLQQCADWACLSIVEIILPLLCPVEHFCISVVDCSS